MSLPSIHDTDFLTKVNFSFSVKLFPVLTVDIEKLLKSNERVKYVDFLAVEIQIPEV